MNHTEQIEKIQKILTMSSAHQKDMVETVSSLSPSVYYDETRFQKEISRLFRSMPLLLARSEHLQTNGDFLTQEVAGNSLLLTRSEAGIQGFFNVCRHRGTQVCAEERGHRQRFVCPYHAWTYDNQGKLRHIPDEAGFAEMERDKRGLTPITVEERHGFVWGRLSGNGPLEVEGFLSTIDKDLSELSLSELVSYQPSRFSMAMNWKLAVDLFLEAYHVRYVHHRSIYPIFFDNLGLFESVGPHQRNFFPKRSIVSLAERDSSTWSLREHCNILYHLFPNSFLLVQPDHISVFHIYPEGVSRSSILTYTLLPESPKTEKAHAYWQKNIDILHSAIKEDFAMGESIQRGAASGANQELLFGRYEQSLGRFHSAVQAEL